MKNEDLRERLLKLGADIPLGTLRRWASEGLIPQPIQYYKPLLRGVGRPKKKGVKSQAHPGRFSYWTAESLEAAAAVWLIRNPPQPIELSDLDLQTVEEGRRKVQTETIKSALQKADDLFSLLHSDCKEVANRFRTYLWPNGFSAKNETRGKIVNFDEKSQYTLIPICIHAIEKAKHQIALYTPVRLTYEWVIREDGSDAWRRMHLERTAFGLEQIDFKVIHLKPCENGYSKNYGFPHTEDYVRYGFVDSFWLKGNQLGERFSDSPFTFPEGFYDEERYVNYWQDDPFGWGDIWAESLYEDQ